MSHYFDTLRAEILHNSSSKDWVKAVLEWDVADIYEEQDGVCTCGYYPITQHNILQNTHTKATLVVGRVCVKRFLDKPDLEKIWRALDKLKNNPGTTVPLVLIDLAQQRAWCNRKEADFLRDIRCKRELSHKQENWRNQLARKILYKAMWKGD